METLGGLVCASVFKKPCSKISKILQGARNKILWSLGSHLPPTPSENSPFIVLSKFGF